MKHFYTLLLTTLLIPQLCLAQKEVTAYWPSDTWRKSTPEMQGMDSKAISKTIELAIQKKLRIHSLQIIRNGYMVTDVYFFPYDGKTVHDLASSTKSITSMLTGIAIGKGFIKDENVSVKEIFPEYRDGFRGQEAPTIAHLLSMRSGLGPDDPASQMTWFKEPAVLRMMQNENWLDYIASMPLATLPGRDYQYNSCNYHLLSGILHRTTGMKTRQFAVQNLFKPLGIKDFIWTTDPQGNTHGWGDLKLHPYDMAKLGYLMLKKGKWNDRQIIPEEWIEKSTGVRVDLPDKNGPFNIDYGYGWFVTTGMLEGAFQATGRGGQYITVWPQKDMVIVYTGGGFDAAVLVGGLLASIKSDQPLADNPEGNVMLQKMTAQAMLAPALKTIKSTGSSLEDFSGKTWQLEENPLMFRSIGIGKVSSSSLGLTLKGEFFNFNKLPVSLDNSITILPNGTYKLPMYATATWKGEDEIEINVNEISNINNYTITLLFEKENLTFRFIDRSMMNNEIVLHGSPGTGPVK